MRFPNPQSLIPNPFHKERERLILWVPVLVGLGVGAYFLPATEPNMAVVGRVLAALMALLILLRRRMALRLLLVAAILVVGGFFAAGLRTQSVTAPVLHNTLYGRMVQGTVVDIQMREKGQKLILADVDIDGVRDATTPERISMSFRKPVTLRIGDRIETKAMLFPPPAPVLPGSYDFARDFYFKRIGATGYSPNPPDVIAAIPDTSWQARLTQLRLSLAERIMKPMKPENGPVATAMMVGEQSAVSEEVSDAMRDAGIYHVLSISGLHMSLAAGLMFFAVRFVLSLFPAFALRVDIKKIAAVVGLISCFAYLLLAGSPVPAIRSFIMVACVMLAILADRRGISLYSLAWAATIILFLQPEALLGASFQLSFAATLGIVALYETYAHALYKPGGIWHKLYLYFLGLMITSLVATLATTPLVLYHFNRMTVWGIATNMLMVPLASFWIMPAALVAFLLMPFGLEHWPLLVLDKGIGLMVASSKFVAGLPYAAFSVPAPTFNGILLVVAGGLWLCLWKTRWRVIGIPFLLAGLLTIVQHKPYDMMISDDGTKVAVRLDNGEYMFLRGKPDSFDGEAWLRHEGRDSGLLAKDVDRADTECDYKYCTHKARNHFIVVGLRKDAPNLCAMGGDIVIAAVPLREPECTNIHWLFDRPWLEDNGAVGLRFTGREIEMETVNQKRGQRPWNYVLYERDNTAITDGTE